MVEPSTSSRPVFNWLLAVILLTGIFAFNGYQGNSKTALPQPFRTELVFSGNNGENRSASSLAITLVSNSFCIVPAAYFDQANAALNYNRLIKVKSDHLSEQFRLVKTALNSIPAQRIPRQSEEEDKPFLTAV